MLSAIDRNHCPQSIGNPVRNRRNPQLVDEQATTDWPVIQHPLRVLFAALRVSNVLAHRRTEGSPMRV